MNNVLMCFAGAYVVRSGTSPLYSFVACRKRFHPSYTLTAIKNKPIRNEDPKDAKLREYQAEIERLRLLIEQRKASERRPKRLPRPKEKALPSDNNCESTPRHLNTIGGTIYFLTILSLLSVTRLANSKRLPFLVLPQLKRRR